MSTHQQQCNNKNTNPAVDLLTQVHSYITDHLEQAQLLGTRGAFVHECGQVGLPCENGGRRSSIKTSGINEHTKSLIFKAFDDLDYPAFFEIWNNPQVLPHGYGSKAYVKLNFRLHLHFNCRLVVVEKSSMETCMQNIRHFFDREGSFLASEQEFIHYFALPFVMEPTTHPSFKGLFEKNNWMRLRSDLSSYLDELRERGAHESELAKLIRSHHFQDLQTKPTDQLSEKESELERMRQVHAQLVSQHQKLRNDHQKLIAVTKELTTALELAARSASSKKALQTNTFTWSSIVLKCGRIYPELFSNGGGNSNQDNHRASTAIGNWLEPQQKAIEGPPAAAQSNLRPKSSPLERKVLSIPPPQVPEKVEEINEDNEEAKAIESVLPPEAERLNYGLIQRHVTVELGRRQSLLLLQALRWLLTRSNNGQRKVFLNSYLRSDILGLKVTKTNPNPVMQLIDAKTILENDPQAMFQQSVVRLMNAMASIKSGRDYLGNYKNVVGVLINSLIEVTSMDQFTIDMIVATLQKLSLKYLVRRQLIESGMLEWLIDHLKQFVSPNENPHLSCYGLEYSTALFMNLCLHRSGKLRCLPMAQEVLNTFLQLLSSANKRQILPYVNGTLYSLLTNPKIAATARQLQFSEKLKLAIAATANDANHEDFESDEEARQQISFVLQQYEESSSSSSSSDNSSIASSTTMSSLSDDGYEEDEESNDEDVDIEEEVDLYDPVVAKDNELSGNALLCAYYLLDQDQERPESNECNLESTDPKTTERILEEELESSTSSSSTKSSSMRSTNNTRKTSSSEGNESPRAAREPCSFFISTSPPLPSLKPQLSSEISSISTETTSTEEPTVKEIEVESEAKQVEAEVQPEVNNKTNSSDTDEGVVLVMEEDRLEPPKAPVKRPKQTKYRSKSMSRKSSTSSSSAGSTGKTNSRSRQHSAAKKGNTTSSRSKTRSSPVRTTTELLPKIGPLSNSPPIPQAASSSGKDSSSSSASSNNNNSSRLLSKVAAAMPLLPPLPMDIDQAKHAAVEGPTLLAIEDKSENKAQQGSLFTVAGADAFTDVFEDENTTLWKLEHGDAKMTMSLTDDKLEQRSYVPPPSPRKRWRKLEPVTLKTTTLL